MRIAICLNGQPRQWKRCYHTWIDNLSHIGDIDFFYHMWDYNTLPSLVRHVNGPLKDVAVDHTELEEIKQTLKPKAFKIESHKDLPPISVEHPIAPWTINQFYAMHYCAMLKRKYEIENNFNYDLVFRVRTDLVLNRPIEVPTTINPNSIYTFINHHDPDYKTYRIGDTFYFADSYSYDQISNFYQGLYYIDAGYIMPKHFTYPPELALYYYMKSIGLYNISNIGDFKIARSSEYKALKGELAPYEVL